MQNNMLDENGLPLMMKTVRNMMIPLYFLSET